jgi:hypothetical protein
MTDIEFKGRVSVIDMGERIITMKDTSGAPHIFKWTEPLDVIMRKWKPGYFLVLNYVADTYLLKSSSYWMEGKEVWPKQTFSAKPSYPRNDRLMSLLSMCKLGAEVFAITTTPNQMDFDTAMDLIIDRAIHDTDTIMKAGEQK